MTSISSLIRIIAGAAIVILAYTAYQRTFSVIDAEGSPRVFGFETGLSTGQLTFAFWVIGLIGAGLLALGIVGMLKRRE